MTDNPDDIDPKVLKQLLTRREEDEGGCVLRARAVSRTETGSGAELLVIAAAVEILVRSGRAVVFERVAIAFHAGPFVRLISIRPEHVHDVADALNAAPQIVQSLASEA